MLPERLGALVRLLSNQADSPERGAPDCNGVRNSGALRVPLARFLLPESCRESLLCWLVLREPGGVDSFPAQSHARWESTSPRFKHSFVTDCTTYRESVLTSRRPER